jgi:hypothetical protein
MRDRRGGGVTCFLDMQIAPWHKGESTIDNSQKDGYHDRTDESRRISARFGGRLRKRLNDRKGKELG